MAPGAAMAPVGGAVGVRSHGLSPAGVSFTKHPTNQTVSQGNAVRLGCAVQGVKEPDITWMKDGEKLYSTDQMFITVGEQHWETFHRLGLGLGLTQQASARAACPGQPALMSC